MEIVDEIIQLAKELVLKMGYHEPILFVRGTKRNVVLSFEKFGDTADDRARIMLNKGANLAYRESVGELEYLIFVDEAWMGRNLDVMPSKDSKRVEVLMINTLDTSSQEQSAIMFEMVRDKQGKVIDFKQNELLEKCSVEGILLPAFQKGYKMIRPTTN